MKNKEFYAELNNVTNMITDDSNLIDNPNDFEAGLNNEVSADVWNHNSTFTPIQAGLYLKAIVNLYVGPEADMAKKIAVDESMSRENNTFAQMTAHFQNEFNDWLDKQAELQNIGNPQYANDDTTVYKKEFNLTDEGNEDLDRFLHTVTDVQAVENPQFQVYGKDTIEVTESHPVKVEQSNDKFVLYYQKVKTIDSLANFE